MKFKLELYDSKKEYPRGYYWIWCKGWHEPLLAKKISHYNGFHEYLGKNPFTLVDRTDRIYMIKTFTEDMHPLQATHISECIEQSEIPGEENEKM